MRLIFTICLGLLVALSAWANCPEEMRLRDSGVFKRPNYRFFFETGHEVDLVLGRYFKTRLFNSYLVPHRLRSHETRQEAERRTYEAMAYPLSNIYVTNNLKTLMLVDGTRTLSLTIRLKKPFDPNDLEIDTLTFDSIEPWVKVDFQGRPKRPQIGQVFSSDDVNLRYAGGTAETINRVLPPLASNVDLFPPTLAMYAERFFKIAASVPYARRIDYSLKYYRSLIVLELEVSKKKQVLAFSAEHTTPVEVIDLASGLKALGLYPSHPAFQKADRLSKF